jgi:hypothetical protein
MPGERRQRMLHYAIIYICMAAIGVQNCDEHNATMVLRVYVQNQLPSGCVKEAEQELAQLSSFDTKTQISKIRCGG